ncbi:uncharacterized protein LOC132616104 isoform X2 [Lycium barbarum]|uniref:uncharacterized protein LOC132616104 isoform X2 n=1 Tax=Lycium barbarum TaxID=112863 RepID=UPI00293F6339|nr:uncharacterized protein LOC132616104 isoform X2 [Lycium barbarum]
MIEVLRVQTASTIEITADANLRSKCNTVDHTVGVKVSGLKKLKRLLTDESLRLRSALRYTTYGKSGVFDAERFIDAMQAFENFITAAKSGGGESLNGRMAELGIMQSQTNSIIPFPSSSAYQTEQPIQTRAALAFLLSDKGIFFPRIPFGGDRGSNANSDSHVDLYPDDFRFVRKSKYVDEEREENSKKLKENISSILKKLLSSYCQQLRMMNKLTTMRTWNSWKDL